MHMADALISPIVGGAMYAASLGTAAYSIRKIKNETDDKKIPLMGVMGAFVFASQMINFSIPGTGSSGHLAGGMLLAILLGSHGGFLTMAVILLIQALFFADGGLLAYGCNVLNLGFYTCFIAYPLIYKKLTKNGLNSKNITIASMLSSIIGLQLGAFSVVIETLLSGKTELPFINFVLLMQPIHLAIGIIEGLVTASIVNFVWKTRPEILENSSIEKSTYKTSNKKAALILFVSALIIGSFISWFASTHPDGLEWSISKISGTTELESHDNVHKFFEDIQKKFAFLPDYSFKSSEVSNENSIEDSGENSTEKPEKWPSMDMGTSVSGVVGSVLTLAFTIIIAYSIVFIKKLQTRKVT